MENKNAREPGANPKKRRGGAVGAIFRTIGRFIATCVMVGVITGCIVASVLTVYILNYIGADDKIDLDREKLGYSSTMLYYDKETDSYQELQKLYVSDNNRIWVDYDDISDHVKVATIATEDKRFADLSYDASGRLKLEGGHQGVDWKRTFGAFVNQFIPGASRGGGSTITQQVIKNITGDDDYRIDRKVREIFRALDVEKRYTKEQILEAYLNVVPFGAGTNGIETAALTYFGKHASELDLAESAAIVGITQYPGAYSPFLSPENNKERQEDVLFFMYDQKKITEKEYDDACDQKLEFKREEYNQRTENIMTYFEDHVIRSVIHDLMEQKNWTEKYATSQLYKSGYKIYTTVDVEMQKFLEEFYLTSENFPAIYNSQYPQSAATIIDHNGKLLAVVGGIGEKTGNLMFNRATMATRHPGSSIKPIGAYALSFEYDRINWSTIIDDHPIELNGSDWPTNYYNSYYGNVTVAYAVQQSINTIPVKLVRALEPITVFNFMHDQLNLHNLVESEVIDGRTFSDVGLAGMALGALTKGVTPLEMAGAYQIFANGGTFTAPYCYTKVEDSAGRIVLEPDTTQRHVITEETSVVLNKLLQTVNTSGTGRPASLGAAMPTAGKTGTSDHDINQWYIGMTPYYICQVWLGYDSEYRINEYGNSVPNGIGYGSYPPPNLWRMLMTPLHEGLEYAEFRTSENVVSRSYCTQSGLLAGPNCGSTAAGWYKTSNIPSTCIGHPQVEADEDEEGGEETGSSSSSGSRRSSDSGTSALRVRDND